MAWVLINVQMWKLRELCRLDPLFHWELAVRDLNSIPGDDMN